MAESVIPVPEALRLKIESMNKELRPFDWREGEPAPKLVLYLLDEDDADWRCHLLDIAGNTLASFLQPEQLHWHAVSMFLKGFQARALKDFNAGQEHAVNTIHKHNLSLIRERR